MSNKDWRIDHSAGRPILVYRDCSVIEAEQAEYVLRLIEADRQQPTLLPSEETPVAVVGPDYSILWLQPDTFESLVRRHNIKVGSLLCVTPKQ